MLWYHGTEKLSDWIWNYMKCLFTDGVVEMCYSQQTMIDLLQVSNYSSYWDKSSGIQLAITILMIMTWQPPMMRPATSKIKRLQLIQVYVILIIYVKISL